MLRSQQVQLLLNTCLHEGGCRIIQTRDIEVFHSSLLDFCEAQFVADLTWLLVFAGSSPRL